MKKYFIKYKEIIRFIAIFPFCIMILLIFSFSLKGLKIACCFYLIQFLAFVVMFWIGWDSNKK